MKNRLWAVALGVVLCCASVCACATVPDTIATVNGTQISGEEFQRALNGFLANYGLTEETLYESMGTSEAVEYKNNIIDEMVLQELMLQYASSNGLAELSDEDRSSITQRVSDYLTNLHESFKEEVQADGSFEGEAFDTEVEQRFNDYIETYGYSEENLEDQFTRQVVLDRVYEDVLKDCDITDDEVRSYYDEQVAAEQEQLEDTDAEDAVSRYVSAQDDTVFYVSPEVAEAVRRVKHILLELPDSAAEQIEQLEEAGDEAGAEEVRSAAMQELQQQAKQIADRAIAGEDFDTLIEQYNEDPGVAYYPDGYEVYEGASFDEAFLSAALALENVGDITPEPVESSYGYHVIMYAGNPVAGPVPFSEVRDEIEDDLRSQKQSELWRDAVESWQDGAQIQKHEFRVQE